MFRNVLTVTVLHQPYWSLPTNYLELYVCKNEVKTEQKGKEYSATYAGVLKRWRGSVSSPSGFLLFRPAWEDYVQLGVSP